MADEEDKTEQPSQKRLDDARQKGDVVRSADFTAAAIVAGTSGVIVKLASFLGGEVYNALLISLSPAITAQNLLDMHDFQRQLLSDMQVAVWALVLVSIVALVLAIASTMAIGGWVFTLTKLWDWQRLSWAQGLKKPFTRQGVMVLLEDALKTMVLGGAMALLLWGQKLEWLDLLLLGPQAAITQGMGLLADDFWVFGLLLFIPGVFDVVMQQKMHQTKMMMTHQEVKDEHKDMQGNPLVKGRIRALRRRMAKMRMMRNVPTASVVVTNPEAYAVALRYQQTSDDVPQVVAKGTGLMAARIRQMAHEHSIPILPAPPLARALYWQTEVGDAIPERLYEAVAIVLGYIEQLQRARMGSAPPPPQWVSPDSFDEIDTGATRVR
ncbi:flagellar biosynthesis protein FlhB [Acidithiobacillus ferrivorans]|nr:flagellar biosynthesis protein FlhB [Acidithiobacillus ferrivorans]